jgi:hypothetical protein
MMEYLIGKGASEIYFLVQTSQRQAGDLDLGKRGRVVARPMRDWAKHPFWNTCRPHNI